jgi:NADPH:quinone reductase-like Zn-dependent oxidoreductase
MKAIAQTVYGSADVLKIRESDLPQPAEGEVLLKVCAASVNAADLHIMTGMPYLMRGMGFGFRGPKAQTRGIDVAGTVEAVGAGVTEFALGDEVFGAANGSFAEFAIAKPKYLARKPARVSWERAASVAVSATSALQGLRAGGLDATSAPGKRVLVIGASGSVGIFAVQIAKAFGAHVTGVCSTAKVDLVRSIGAEEIIDYSRESIATAGRTFDLILDTGGNRTLTELRSVLTDKGSLVIVGGETGGKFLGGIERTMRAGIISPFVGQSLRGLVAGQKTEDLRELARLIETGAVTPVVDRTFPLAEAADAVRYLQSGKAAGKVVIVM